MTDPNELFPEDSADLKPWHPLMGFGWDAVRRVEAHHFCGIADVKAMPPRDDFVSRWTRVIKKL